MTESIQAKGLGMAAFLSAIFWIGVPIILLESDFRTGGIDKALVAVQSSEYDEIRVLAFYVSLVAFVVFLLLGVLMLIKKDFSFGFFLLSVLSIASLISVYFSFQGYMPSYFGLMICAVTLWKIYLHKKNTLNEED